MLEVNNLKLRFGGILALNDVSFNVGSSQICGLIGPNGAGKTSLFNCLSRLYIPSEGTIYFNNINLLSLKPHLNASLGIARTFQNVALFETLSVRENILIGGHSQIKGSFLAAALDFPSISREEKKMAIATDEMLARLQLEKIAYTNVSELNFASRKKVELARALVSNPKLLLLDEPAGGLNQEEVDELMQFMRTIRDEMSLSILLVEHHLNLVMKVCDHVVALNFGRKIADGTPEEVQNNEEVILAYLGKTDE